MFLLFKDNVDANDEKLSLIKLTCSNVVPMLISSILQCHNCSSSTTEFLLRLLCKKET